MSHTIEGGRELEPVLKPRVAKRTRPFVLSAILAIAASCASAPDSIIPPFTFAQTGSSELIYSFPEHQIILPKDWKYRKREDGKGMAFQKYVACGSGINPEVLIINPLIEISTKPVKSNVSLNNLIDQTISAWRIAAINVTPASMGGVEALRIETTDPDAVPGSGPTKVSYIAIINGKAVVINWSIPPFYSNRQDYVPEFDQIASSFKPLK